MRASDEFTIGDLANKVQCKVQTIRYYEQIGLMPTPARTRGNQRLYRLEHLRRLTFIRHSRQLGFGLDAIRALLQLSDQPRHTCADADAIAREHVAEIEARVSQLQALKQEIEHMVARCSGHGCIAECQVIGGLADHSKCLHAEHRAL